MRSFSKLGATAAAATLMLACAVSNAQSGASTSKTATGKTVHSTSAKHSSHRKKSKKLHGQQKIDADRARSIQEALIREHYLTGEATGTWNQSCEDAMRRFQADHGWQSKTVPDSRALIALGLGPSKDHLLNPESAMTTGPEAPRAQSTPTTSHSPAPGDALPASQPSDPPQPQ